MAQIQPASNGWSVRLAVCIILLVGCVIMAVTHILATNSNPPRPTSKFSKEMRQKIVAEYQAGMDQIWTNYHRRFSTKVESSDDTPGQQMANQRQYVDDARNILKADIEKKWKIDDDQLNEILVSAEHEHGSNVYNLPNR